MRGAQSGEMMPQQPEWKIVFLELELHEGYKENAMRRCLGLMGLKLVPP